MELGHEGLFAIHIKQVFKSDKTGLSSIIRVYGKENKKLGIAPWSQWILAHVVNKWREEVKDGEFLEEGVAD